jgi:hypothetical protein
MVWSDIFSLLVFDNYLRSGGGRIK